MSHKGFCVYRKAHGHGKTLLQLSEGNGFFHLRSSFRGIFIYLFTHKGLGTKVTSFCMRGWRIPLLILLSYLTPRVMSPRKVRCCLHPGPSLLRIFKVKQEFLNVVEQVSVPLKNELWKQPGSIYRHQETQTGSWFFFPRHWRWWEKKVYELFTNLTSEREVKGEQR